MKKTLPATSGLNLTFYEIRVLKALQCNLQEIL